MACIQEETTGVTEEAEACVVVGEAVEGEVAATRTTMLELGEKDTGSSMASAFSSKRVVARWTMAHATLRSKPSTVWRVDFSTTKLHPSCSV